MLRGRRAVVGGYPDDAATFSARVI